MAGRNTNAKEEFNKHRKILLLNIPPSTEGEIREFLNGFKAQKININESLDSALVTLNNGIQVDEAVQKLNNKQFKDNIVTVRQGYSNQLVCIAHIPLAYTDSSFREFCKKYGPVEYSYIMRTVGSGLSKGYGLVEFNADTERVKQIKSEIDWQSLDGQTLHADFVSESFQTWDGLQSRCLLINNIPEEFVDVSKLRETFSCVTSPVYCQIIAKGDKSLGFGIIEFRTPEDAEKTWMKLKNEKINGKDVVLTFCIPGKSAVVINNRIMWKYGDKLQKSSSLLPDPVSAKPVIAGNPIVISLTKHNQRLMEDFTSVLGELQQAYVSQMMSPENKPGKFLSLLGPAPSLPLSPMMNPNMQLGLLVMLALHIHAAKKEQFTGVLAKQLNTLSEQERSEKPGPKPSILGDPMTGQANVILTSLKQQLNQVPVIGENGKPLEEPKSQDDKLKFIVKKFVANSRYLNLGLLSNLGQLLVNMKHSDIASHDSGGKGQSLLGPMPGSNLQLSMNTPLVKGASLLGDPPAAAAQSLQSASVANASINSSIMQAMGLNVGSGSSMGSMGQTLLSQISQGLVHQIGQNILYQMTTKQTGSSGPGKGLLGDVPTKTPKSKGSTAVNKSLLGEAPKKSGQASSTSTSVDPLDQGTWKSMESRKRMEMTYSNKNQMDRWGSGAVESGYDGKGGMGTGYNDYGYGNDAYGGDVSGNMGGGSGNYGGYGEGGSDYYNYQSQYGYGGQGDNAYQTEGGYNNQFATGYGMGGSGDMSSNAGYGMSSGFEGNQSSGVNYQDGQIYGNSGQAGSGDFAKDGVKYGGDGYDSGVSGVGYGYGCRNDLGEGYNTSMGDGLASGGMGRNDAESSSMGSGGMGSGMMGNSSMSGGMMGNSTMSGGVMGNSGMGGGGMMGNSDMSGGLMGNSGMSGMMGNSGMGGGGMMGNSGMGGGGGMMGNSGMGGGGMMGNSGMGGGMGNSGMGGMGNLGMGGSGMGNSGMGGSGGMGNSGMGGGMMGSGGMDSSMMGSGYMGNAGMGGNMMGSGTVGGGMESSGSYIGSNYMGNSGTGSGQQGSGVRGQMENEVMGSSQMGSGGMGSNQMGSGGMGSNQMGSGGMGSSQMGSWGMGSSQMGSGGMGYGQMGSGGMGYGQIENEGMGSSQIGMGSGGMGGGQIGRGGSLMGNGNMGSGMLENSGGGNMGSGLLGNGGGNLGSGLSGSGSGGMSSMGMGNTLTDVYGTGAGMGNTSRSNMGSGVGVLGGAAGSNMSSDGGNSNNMGGSGGGMYSRENSAYFTGIGSSSSSAGLLAAPSRYIATAGQKRSHNQFQSEAGPESSDYTTQHSQSQAGNYMDTYKRNRLY